MSQPNNLVKQTLQNMLSSKISKIEVIGHKKSLQIELRLHCVDQDSYKQLFDILSQLDINGLIDYALNAFNLLRSMGIDENKLDTVSDMVRNAKKDETKKA